jgi:hypothetical protein
MSERDGRHDEQPAPEGLVPGPGDLADEPGWTDEIRRLRKARGRRLKELFDAFDRDEETPPP